MEHLKNRAAHYVQRCRILTDAPELPDVVLLPFGEAFGGYIRLFKVVDH